MIHRGNGRSKVHRAAAHRLPANPASPLRESGGWRRPIESYIAEHPVICIAAALTLGAIVGWFVKRR